MTSSGTWRPVVWFIVIKVSEEHADSVSRAEDAGSSFFWNDGAYLPIRIRCTDFEFCTFCLYRHNSLLIVCLGYTLPSLDSSRQSLYCNRSTPLNFTSTIQFIIHYKPVNSRPISKYLKRTQIKPEISVYVPETVVLTAYWQVYYTASATCCFVF